MTYAISDIHGCLAKYQDILKKIHFGEDDTLYVLGDVLDRGKDGFKILLDIIGRPNVKMLLGNHEAMAIQALPCLLRSSRKGERAALDEDGAAKVGLWFCNGGQSSLLDFLELDAEQARTAWDYLLSLPLYKEIEVGNQKFVLVHGGLDDFSPSRPLEDYQQDEILWCRPKPDMTYYPDKFLIYGHTPTQILYAEAGKPTNPAKIFRNGKSIDIDCGCVFPNGRLGCLCLDTMEEIYSS